MAYTLGDIINEVRNRADLIHSEFISDDEITSYTNYSIGELYGLLVNAFGGTYFATSANLSVVPTGTQTTETVPENMYKVLGVDLYLSDPSTAANNRITLSPFNFNERNRANALNLYGYATQWATNYRYNLFNDRLLIQPQAASSLALKLWYVPVAPTFTISDPLDTTQTFTNNSTLNGWLEYVIVDVCIKCKTKEETDSSMFVRQKALLTERIRNEAQNRDISQPASVSDIYAAGTVTDTNWGWTNWGGGPGWTY
jgi:hypothetical protein